jgi:DNA polymerase III subunit delta'
VSFDAIVGQDTAISFLRGLVAARRLPHALLFQGPDAVGKATTARALAASLLCLTGAEHAEPCVDCRLLEAGNHPDFLFVTRQARKTSGEAEPDDGDDAELKSVITVEQIRELTQLASRSPRRAERRLFLIDPAERMNAEAQNALLKTLEEPAGSTVLILVTSRPHLLLPTVRSRCVPVRFRALDSGELGRLLATRGVPASDALTRAALSEGRPGAALTLDLETQRKRREELLEAVERLSARPPALPELSRFAERVAGSSEETLADGLGLLESIVRDAARAALRPNDPALIHVDVRPRVERIGQALGAPRAAAIVRSIELLRGQLRFHLNKTLVAESVLAAIAGGPLP